MPPVSTERRHETRITHTVVILATNLPTTVLLKRLSLAGFKSFADRTRLEFDTGVNVVVGPNGTGKSNILDAIAWVMGTQATRTLRTERMEDVVFAGTATRPQLNRAEVALTFANDDGFLPLDLAEITITRRLFRDGTSEYLLNGAPCRLLDIHELLSDGGVGRHQHVLVGQGQIGSILNARPDEHRAVIEEAAGITKHRNRRDRSVRRLEATDIDVERLHDLLGEKRKQLRPLKRQANAAARFDAVRDEARALQLWLGGSRLRDIRTRLAAAEAEHTDIDVRIDADTDELDELKGNLEALRATAGDAGAALERDSSAAARLETVRERLKRIATVARERRRSMTSRIEGAGERTVDLEREAHDLDREIEVATVDIVELRQASERFEQRLTALEDEERSLAEQAQLPAEGVMANLRGDLYSLEAAETRDAQELDGIANRKRSVDERIEEDRREVQALQTAIQVTDGAVGEAQQAYEKAKAGRAETQAIWDSDEEVASERRLVLTAAEARVEALDAAMAGVGDPAAREATAQIASVIGGAASLLDVPAAYAAAVDAVLGTWRDAYITSDRDAIRGVAEVLKTKGLGGVALLAPARANEAPARAVAKELGLDALIDMLGPAAHGETAFSLLGDVVVVEGWAAGWRVVTEWPAIRAVTPEGDLITIDGMVVAEPDGVGPAAVEAARVEVEIAQRELARIESHRATSRRSFDTARGAERFALEALEDLEAKVAGLAEALGLFGRSMAEHVAERERLVRRAAAIDEARSDRTARMISLRARLGEFEGEEAERQAAWEAIQQRRQEVAERRDEARRRREEAATGLAAALERKSMSQRRREVIDAELRQLELLPDTDDRIERLGVVEAGATEALEIVAGHLAVLRERQLHLRDRAGTVGQDLTEAEERREALSAAVVSTRDRLSVLAVEMAELRVRDEATAEGLRRDADATEEEALVAPQPEIPDGEEAEQRLDSLRADLRRMGPINPLAAAEHEELAGQVDLLEGQLADLEESRSELRRVIKALDDEMAVLFRAAFDEISALYEEHFSLVFPGGRGGLRLIDPDHPLETGVEVEAQPHGKKVGRLSLLSGGERSLAALAFLFAVFRARPSPFYVLDEVEAALDDANLARFLRLVDTLRSSAQLVIITHQQQTMEAADMLYGVTMEPGGSSKVIAKRMQHAPVS